MSLPNLARPRRRLAALLVVAAAAIGLSAPAMAAQECLADAADDLRDLVTGDEGRRNPRADILALCVTHSPGSLLLEVRLGEATDVATYPAWVEGRSALVLEVDVNPPAPGPATGAPDLQREYDVVLGRASGVPAHSVLDVATGEVVCGAPLPAASLPTAEDPTFRLRLDTAACLPAEDGAAPDVVRAGAYIIFAEQGGNPTLDEVPADGERFGTSLGTEPRPDVVGHEGVLRLGGATRIETAVAVSRAVFLGDGTAGAVVLATGEPPTADGSAPTSSPDALAAAPLAVHASGPLLLLGRPSATDQLPAVVLEEIRRVLPSGRTIFLVGGQAVIHPAVDAVLEAEGWATERLAGATREGTSLAVAQRISPEPTRIVLADGGSFAHPLLGAAYAAATNALRSGPDGGPAGRAVLLLTQTTASGPQLDPAHGAYLQTPRPGREFVVVGQAAAEAARAGGLPVTEANTLVVDDDDVLDTAVRVAQRYDGAGAVRPPVQEDPEGPAPLPGIAALAPPRQAVVASGVRFPDAISGAALAGTFGAPLLLSRADALPDGARALLRSLPDRLAPGFVVGGPAALRDAVADQLSVCGVLDPARSTPECRRR